MLTPGLIFRIVHPYANVLSAHRHDAPVNIIARELQHSTTHDDAVCHGNACHIDPPLLIMWNGNVICLLCQ